MTSAYVVVHVDEEDALRVDSDPHGVVHLVEDQRFAWLLDLTAEKRRAEKNKHRQNVYYMCSISCKTTP